jgi:hypothetical protein
MQYIYILFLGDILNIWLGAGIFIGDRWYQNMATVEILHAQFYILIIKLKTSFYCNKAYEGKINLKLHIFYKHIAILCINMT